MVPSRTHRSYRSWCRLLLVLVVVGCRGNETPTSPATSASAAGGAGLPDVLPSRAEAVALADQWAVQAVKLSGSERGILLQRAGMLRERIWRMESRDADVLEAIELYRSAAAIEWKGACDAEIQRVLLAAEWRNEPTTAYTELYRLGARPVAKPCRQRLNPLFASLSTYKPAADVLADIDRRAKAASADDAQHEAKATISSDERGRIIVPTLRSVPDKPATIQKIERYGAEDNARIVVFITHPTLFKVGWLPASSERGPRLYVDIERARYKGKLDFDVGGVVQRVRVGQQTEGTRVVLDLASEIYRKVFYLPEPFRLVIDVSKEPPKGAAPRARGRRTVQRVVLDPGHGGHDPGAVGPGGLREKDVTLDVAHRAAPLIARELGVSTLLTRDADDFVPLDERTARANAFQADLFVSIHCNASEDPRSSGVMTFVLDASKDAMAAQIAARENAASPAAAAELATVMSQVLDEGSLKQSLHFASLLQRSTVASLTPGYPGVRDHGVKRAGFYVLAGARMPSVLYEASFISHPEGEIRLNTGDYRQKLADAIVNAIRAYHEGL